MRRILVVNYIKKQCNKEFHICTLCSVFAAVQAIEYEIKANYLNR